MGFFVFMLIFKNIALRYYLSWLLSLGHPLEFCTQGESLSNLTLVPVSLVLSLASPLKGDYLYLLITPGKLRDVYKLSCVHKA